MTEKLHKTNHPKHKFMSEDALKEWERIEKLDEFNTEYDKKYFKKKN